MSDQGRSSDVVGELADRLSRVQDFNQAYSYILIELIRGIAQLEPYPQQYVSSMFKRVRDRADTQSVESEGHPVSAECRLMIETVFRLAGKGLRK